MYNRWCQEAKTEILVQAEHIVPRLEIGAGVAQIRCQDLEHLGRNLSNGAKIGIIAAVAGRVEGIIFRQWLERN